MVRGGLLPPEILEDNPVPTWDEQLKWEADYGKNCSLALDMKIFMKTFQLLFIGQTRITVIIPESHSSRKELKVITKNQEYYECRYTST